MPRVPNVEPRPAWAARSLEGRATVNAVARLLAPLGIAVMPLKGVLMDALEPSMIGTRYLGDVDVLVNRYPTALAALERAGWRTVGSAAHATTFVTAASSLHLDVHREVTSTVAYGLTATHLFERGTADTIRFGAPVVVPDPLDEFAHLVAHFVQGRHTSADQRHAADFARVARRAKLDAATVARHLDALGLGRAARYALSVADDGFSAAVLRALASDPIGSILARVSGAGLARYPRSATLGAFFPPLLARSLPRGGAMLALQVAARALRTVSADPPLND